MTIAVDINQGKPGMWDLIESWVGEDIQLVETSNWDAGMRDWVKSEVPENKGTYTLHGIARDTQGSVWLHLSNADVVSWYIRADTIGNLPSSSVAPLATVIIHMDVMGMKTQWTFKELELIDLPEYLARVDRVSDRERDAWLGGARRLMDILADEQDLRPFDAWKKLDDTRSLA